MLHLLLTLSLFFGSAVAIYIACEYFLNGVEWVGLKLAVGQKATGTILAAFGTALPETVVTFIAVVFGVTAAQKKIGIGAALGGPLVLGTIAYAVVGLTLLVCCRHLHTGSLIGADFKHLSRDQAWFFVIFIFKLGLGLIAFTIKPWLGILFLGAYAAYFCKEVQGKSDEAEGSLEPLKLSPRTATPSTKLAVIQTLAALVVIFISSRIFVAQIEALGPYLGLKPQLLALLLSPIATELPEILNAVIWIRQGKLRLALANISGAMMIQATVPTAFGLFFTPWLLDRSLILAGVITALSAALLYAGFRKGWMSEKFLALFLLPYLAFCIGLLVLHF